VPEAANYASKTLGKPSLSSFLVYARVPASRGASPVALEKMGFVDPPQVTTPLNTVPEAPSLISAVNLFAYSVGIKVHAGVNVLANPKSISCLEVPKQKGGCIAIELVKRGLDQ